MPLSVGSTPPVETRTYKLELSESSLLKSGLVTSVSGLPLGRGEITVQK